MLKTLLLFAGMAMVGFVAMILLVAEGERMEAERDYYANQ